jgi:anti-sigma B factor antagonist
MEIAVNERQHHSALVRLSGDFDLHSCAGLRTVVEPLMVTGSDQVILDLSGVTFIDSSGLGTLIGLQKHANEVQVGLALCAPTPQLRKIIDLTGLTGAFSILAEAPAPHAVGQDDTYAG